MPFVLPGLFDFSTGVSRAIDQNAGRLANEGQVTSNYLNTLNAFNASLNTNDNLELRQGFAAQPEGTSILDRFSNFAQQSTNPFAANQALTAGAALSPLAALTGLSNPNFAAQQGLPSTFQAGVGQGLFGATALGQQQFNQALPGLVGQQNPGLDPATLAALTVGAAQQGQQNDSQAELLQARQEIANLRRLLTSTPAPTASTQTQTTSAGRLQGPLINSTRPGGQPAPVIGGATATNGTANSRL